MNSYAGKGNVERFVAYNKSIFFTWDFGAGETLHENLVRELKQAKKLPDEIAKKIDGIKIPKYYYFADPRILCGQFEVSGNKLKPFFVSFYGSFDAIYEGEEDELIHKYFSYQNPQNLKGMPLYKKRWEWLDPVLKITEEDIKK